jgi:hypothetical protein
MLWSALMARRRKSGYRTKKDRLSRAYKTVARDLGSPESLLKRASLINGADPQLAATASGILLANEMITREQHSAALTYSWAHAMVYHRPWRQACPLADRGGSTEAPEDLVELAKEKLAAMDAALNWEQRLAVGNLAVFGWLPGWFWVSRGVGRGLASDERERAALITGLERLARM